MYILFIGVLLSLLVPGEAHFSVLNVRVELYRLLLLVAFSLLLIRNQLRHTNYYEYVILLFCVICSFSYLNTKGISGLQSAIILFLEVYVCYFFAKVICKSPKFNFQSLLFQIGIAFIGFFILAIFEAKTGFRVTHVFTANLFGTSTVSHLSEGYIRFGIHRSSVIFAHPILYGVVCATLLPLFISAYKGKFKSVFIISLLGGVVLSVSSVALLMVVFQIGVTLIEFLNQKIKVIRRFVFVSGLVLLVAVQLFSQGGVVLFLSTKLALNPYTAYYRYMQWEFASVSIFENKLFGLGDSTSWGRPGWMVSSLDSYWLTIGVTNGLLAASSLLVFWLMISKFIFSSYLARQTRVNLSFYLSSASLFFASFTVDFFDRLQPFSYLFLGLFVGTLIKEKMDN